MPSQNTGGEKVVRRDFHISDTEGHLIPIGLGISSQDSFSDFCHEMRSAEEKMIEVLSEEMK